MTEMPPRPPRPEPPSSPAPLVSPIRTAKPPPAGRGGFFILGFGLGCLFGGAVIGILSDEPQPPTPPMQVAAVKAAAEADTAVLEPEPAAAPAVVNTMADLPAKPEVKPEPEPEPSPWLTTEHRDEMRDGVTKLACTSSTNQVELRAPYDNVGARLCVRKSPKFGTDVYITLNGDGQILCRSYNRCTIPVRFDAKPTQSFSGAEASDNSSNIVFISNATRMIAGLKGSKRTMVELEFYRAGVQQLSFETRDLKW